MFVVIFAIFLVLGLLFWSTIQTAVKTMSNSNLSNGYLWFFSLLIINIIVLSVIIGYYYYITSKSGNQGLQGDPGFPGQSGDECIFNDSCKVATKTYKF
jgi:hypothetical protein